MAWVRIDDQAPRHVKMLKAGPAACWLWVCGIAHCQSLLTDGFIADEAIPMIGVKSGAKKLADTLVDVGLFERVDGGYRVHDYHAHNATAEEARQQRAKVSAQRAEAGRAGGVRSGIARRSNEANAKQNPSNASKQNEAPSHPIPSHPTEAAQNAASVAAAASTNVALMRVGKQQPIPHYSRLRVFPWMVHDLLGLLGAHAVAFDLDAYLLRLDTSGDVLPAQVWPWLREMVAAEAARRGLTHEQPATEPTNKRIAGLVKGGEAFLRRVAAAEGR